MADLIKKFFQSELTEAEDKALARRLTSSEAEAERFAEQAERIYYSFGLPEPKAPGRLIRFFRSSLGRFITTLAVLGGIGAFVWWAQVETRSSSVPLNGVMPTPCVVEPQKTEVPPSGKEQLIGTLGPPPVPSATVKIPSTPRIPMGETPVPVVPGEAPPKPGFDTDYRNLKVVVDQEKAGPITVQILSPQGFAVRRLFAGPLGAGKWAFSWDGIMDDGLAAESGIYHIEVKSETVTMSKEVIIR